MQQAMGLTPFQAGLVIKAHNEKERRFERTWRWHDWHLGLLSSGRIDVSFEDYLGDTRHADRPSPEMTKARMVARARAHNKSQQKD